MKNGRFGWMAATVFLGACGPAKDAADAGAAGGSTGGQADVGSGGSSGGSGGAVGGGSGGSGGATGGATGGSGGATGGSGGAAGGSGGATGGSGGAPGGSGGATGGTTGGSGGATGGSGGATGGSGGAAGGSGGAAGGAAGGAGGAAGGAGGSAGGAGGAGGAEPPEAPISLRVLNVDIPDGGEYFEPLNEGNARVPLFSFYTDVYTLTNHSDAPVTIDSVEIVPAVGVYPEEFELRNCLLPEGPQVIRDQAMDAGADLSFDLCFSPVGGDLEAPEDEQYGCAEDTDCDCLGGGVDCPPKLYRGGYCLAGFCSASRRAEVVITYDGGRTYTFTAAGRGRPREVASLTHGTPTWEYSIGAPTTDELTGGMAADPDGNVFFTSNVPQVINVFANDILIGRVNADGSFAWLKAWSGKYQDTSPDSGQNGETGGTAGSIVRGPDGSIYVVGYHSNTNSNSGGFLVVLKIDPNDGALIWHKVWGGDPLVQGSGGASGYAIDVQGDRVYVTGEQRGVIFLSLNAGDGSLIYEHTLDLAPGSVSRGYAIRADAAGNVYLGGLVNGRGFVARVTGGNTDNPAVQWVKRVNMGIGSNINHIDIDAAGNAYLSLDRRGANTAFGAISVNPQGEFRWAKTYHPAGQGDRENTHVVRVVGDSVYVGGRVGFGQFDTSAGDGLLVKASLADGAMEWTGIYYTGTALEDIAETRVKGIAVVGEDLLIANQHYTGPNNSNHYFGYWYDGTRRPGDPNDSRAFDWLNYCPRGDANCVHGRPDRPDCLPDYECDFIYEDIPGIAFGTPANQLLLDADTAFGLDRNIPPNRVPSFNAYIDLSTQQVVQLEGSVGAPCGTGVGDCGIICSELDDATCQAGGARDTCTRIPRFGDFAWCESKRGTPTHKALRTAAGLGGDGEVFLTKIRLR